MLGRYAVSLSRGERRSALDRMAQRLGLKVRLATGDLLLVADEFTLAFEDRGTIVLGQIFDAQNRPLKSLPDLLTQYLDLPDARTALDHHWGNFALFQSASDVTSVYRDPSGSIPVYCLNNAGEMMLVSDAELAFELDLLENATN